jgi:hypothetical protein
MRRVSGLLRELSRCAAAIAPAPRIQLCAALALLFVFAFRPVDRSLLVIGSAASYRGEASPAHGRASEVRALVLAAGAASEDALGGAIERSQDPRLLTNLAEALFDRAERKQQPSDFALAFSAAERALTLDHDSLDSRFVLANALKQLHLRREARRAFQDYLSRDDESPRATVARWHLGHLTPFPSSDELLRRATLAIAVQDTKALARVVAVAPQPVRLMGEEDLLGEWADAYIANDAARASAALAGAAMIGRALVQTGSDHALSDATSAIDAARTDRGALKPMATAYREYRDARKSYGLKRDAHTRAMMTSAARELATCHSPLTSRARVFEATIGHYFGDSGQSVKTTTNVLNELTGHRREYPVAAGQALWTQGLSLFALGKPAAALRSYTDARELFVMTGEAPSMAGIETVLAEVYGYLGDADSGWRHRVEGLRWIGATDDYKRRQTTYSEAAAAALALRYVGLASVLTQTVAEAAAQTHDPVFATEAALMQS